ncbi:hypothetical protein GQ55_5G393100 [Panicum hallii var. hallii]|uniref:Myb/SANT-like domain-containing protein n=1 Tax=Panicum hallii var. hallii TaxID=1504633 RepID=A0A2T7DN30_9POAL|nr:hypothetical protein GQ55_5G393100 [Panicum hallii var. hallii]
MYLCVFMDLCIFVCLWTYVSFFFMDLCIFVCLWTYVCSNLFYFGVTKLHPMEVESKSAAGQTVWTASQSTFVHTFLANFIDEGLRTSTGFKKVHLNKCAEALNEKFKLNRTGDHIGNHLKTLRRRYVKINQLKSLSGALWDEEQYIISLDHEHYRNHFESVCRLATVVQDQLDDHIY